jgi:hypothetical protein
MSVVKPGLSVEASETSEMDKGLSCSSEELIARTPLRDIYARPLGRNQIGAYLLRDYPAALSRRASPEAETILDRKIQILIRVHDEDCIMNGTIGVSITCKTILLRPETVNTEDQSGLAMVSSALRKVPYAPIGPAETRLQETYSLNLRDFSFIDYHGTSVSVLELIQRIEDVHLSPLRPFRGFPYRVRARLNRSRCSLISIELACFKRILSTCLGFRLKPSGIENGIKGYPSNCLLKSEESVVKIKGIEINKRAAFTCSLCVVCISIVLSKLRLLDEVTWQLTVAISPALTVLCLLLFDGLIAALLRLIINREIRQRTRLRLKLQVPKKFLGLYF